MEKSKLVSKKAKKLLTKLGCTGALFHILNEEFGYHLTTEVNATMPLCGGIMQQGYQCGMIWGTALGIGAESYHSCKNIDKAICLAINTTSNLLELFLKTAKKINCRDITKCDWTKKSGWIKYFITGKQLTCSRLIGKWAAEAVQSADKILSQNKNNSSQPCISCASEVAEKMGASDEEIVMVAGFAGGIGLSGNACGALSAAIWIKSLAWSRNNPNKFTLQTPETKKILNAFRDETGSVFLCNKITGQYFKSTDEHTKFIKNGGCNKLIDVIAQS